MGWELCDVGYPPIQKFIQSLNHTGISMHVIDIKLGIFPK